MAVNRTVKFAFHTTLPVLFGYLFLGIAFGLLLQNAGYGALWALVCSVFVYAGSMQFVLVSFFAGGIGLGTIVFMTFMINSRHIFYGISFLERYRAMGKAKWYLIFSLTDETYSILCSVQMPKEVDEKKAFFLISLFDQCYWITGSVLGVLIGDNLNLNTQGVEFAMTALFVVIFLDQWREQKNKHLPALLGLGCAALFLILFGPDNFILPSLAAIVCLLVVLKPCIGESGVDA
ncbi:MAG: AzlC family ABC transporter permease [Clostridiales bacterium]|nr:AzlC family ABC transporter permease [Clostridiales bacterium]